MTRFRTMALSAVFAPLLILAGCGGDSDGGGGDETLGGELLAEDPVVILEASAEVMGEVTTARFALTRSGAPEHIDSAETLTLDSVIGRFAAPDSAEAIVKVTINDSLTTELGAVSIDGEAWLTNPITGRFEDLPESYNIDPADFFDPKGGWRPLLEDLTDAVLLGTEDRGGGTYHLTATAAADRIEVVTAGLVDEQVPVDLWVYPASGLVHSLEFATDGDAGDTRWVALLSEYGSDVEISRPDGV